MQPEIDFNDCFRALTHLPESETPFPWQEKLFNELVQRRFRETCDIPTGLGKTSVIAIWLLALAHHALIGTPIEFPRRMVYVVNRRTVVDQATREVERMRDALDSDSRLRCVNDALRMLEAVESERPLAISTLRGQFADNAEWRHDPAKPSVIVGTVDMIGSRLLFSGYGRGFKSRPLHAGFLGQDTLLVHDEAHLEPAFQTLLEEIKTEQKRCNEFMKLQVMAMTATTRVDGKSDTPLFTDLDKAHPEVKKRIQAKKGIAFYPIDDEKKISNEIVKCALDYMNSDQAILIYARSVKNVSKIRDHLNKEGLFVQTLTGTLRGLERDALAKDDPIFARFMPKTRDTSSKVGPRAGTVYLVCTSAGEVGVNISADHLVCDLTPFDSMAQRFGRVNRFGREDSKIDVVYTKFQQHPELNEANSDSISAESDDQNVEIEESKNGSENESEQKSPFNQACMKTLLLLQDLPKYDNQRYNASPLALNSLPSAERQAAFTPQPIVLPTSDILFDAWALTSVRQTLPGRPAVADWLHGIAEWEPPETHVVWREDVSILTSDLLEKYKREDLLDDYPIKPHELIRDRTDRVFENLEKIAERCPGLNAWIMESDSVIRTLSLRQLVERNKQRKPVENLANCTVILPPEAGGLKKGFLDGSAAFDETQNDRYDVSDRWIDRDNNPMRCRIWDEEEPPIGMRRIRRIDTRPDAEDEEEDAEQPSCRRYWYWYVRPSSADDDGSRTASQKQDLDSHLHSAEAFASAITAKLELRDVEALAVTLAARWHDLGKNRKVWQISIGNLDYHSQVLAKSGGKMRPVDLGNFRHEFGSLLDVVNLSEFKELKTEVQDLVLHMIAAHHGRARPHFPSEEAFDSNHADNAAAEIAREVPRRFGRLQRKYGRWGLAYLESLARASDALASQSDDMQGVVKTAPAHIQEGSL